MALIKLTHVYSYLDQLMNNRYFYFTAADPTVGHLDDLADAFDTDVVPLVKQLQSAGVNHLRIDTFVVEGVLFSTKSISGAGEVIGEASPSWNALSFFMARGTAVTKSGGKRIGGLSEIILNGNSLAGDPTYQGFIDDYAAILGATLLGTLGSYVPQLVKFDPANPGQVLASQDVVSGSFTKVTTQNTRKP